MESALKPTPSVLVTGAGGFLGRRLCRTLTTLGFDVVALQRTGAPAIPAAGGHLVCDVRDEAGLSQALGARRFDAVVHCAARLPGRADRAELFAVNAGGTAALLAHAVKPGCHVVLLSTGLVYGAQKGPLHEALPCLATHPYAQSKLAAEAVATAFGQAAGAPVTVMRASVLYGNDAPAHMLLNALVRALRAGEPFPMTRGEQLRDFLHVEDAAFAIATVLEKRIAGVFNLCSGHSTRVWEAAEALAAIAGRPELLRPGALPYRSNEVFDYRLDGRALRTVSGWSPKVDFTAGLRTLWEMSA